jgi:hypothetical protein
MKYVGCRIRLGGREKFMVSADSDKTWFKKETAVYYKFFWLSPGLVLAWLAMNLLINIEVAAGIAVLLIYVIPYILIFVSGILGIWGTALICLGLRKKEPVAALTIATITSVMPFLLCGGALIVAMSEGVKVHFFQGF